MIDVSRQKIKWLVIQQHLKNKQTLQSLRIKGYLNY